MKIGDLVKVYKRGTWEFRIGMVMGDVVGYYVPVQIDNILDLYNFERVKVINQ